MAQYYTPFFAQAGEAIGRGLESRGLKAQKEQQNKMAGDAYMGDPTAMQELMRVNPELGIQIGELAKKRKNESDQSNLQKRTKFKKEYDDVMKNVAKFSSFDEAKEYGDKSLLDLRRNYPEVMTQIGEDEVFDEEDFELAKKLSMKESTPNRKDYTKESWSIYEGSGNQSDLDPVPKAPLVNVDLRKQDPFTAEVSKQFGKEFVAERASAMDAVKSLESANEAVSLLDSGIITGTGANFILGVGKALKQAGVYSGEALANTEAFYANQAVQVASIIKAFGAGTGLSDADREYAEKAAAGKITMTEESIRKIIDINSRASTRVIERFNEKAQEVNKSGKIPFSLTVPVPEFDGASIDSPKTKEEFEMLPSGTIYISPSDGKKYRKP